MGNLLSSWNGLFRWNLNLHYTLCLAIPTGVLLFLVNRRKSKRLPPGPTGLPFIGRLDLMSPDMYLKFTEMSKEYGEIFSVNIANRLTIVLNSSQVIHEAFVDQGIMFAGRPYPWVMKTVGVKEEINNGTYSQEWKDWRSFALQALKKFGYGSDKLESKITDEIKSLLNHYEIASSSKTAINPREDLPKTMANILLSIMIDKHYEFDDPELLETMSLIQQWQEKVGEANLMDVIPVLRFFPWQPIKKLQIAKNNLVKIYQKHIKDHKETFDPGNIRDVIDIYLQDKGLDFDDDRLIGLFFSFAGDAIDSLPEVMVWLVLTVVSHPEVQNKMRKEIEESIGSSRFPAGKDRQNCPYIEAVIMETLRYSTFIPLSEPHRALDDTVLCNYYIPKDANIFANFYAVHMDQRIWENPEQFRPERFLSAEGKLVKRDAFMPYGIGRRQCVGDQLSNKVLFLFITSLLQKYEIKLPLGMPAPSLQPQKWYVRKAEDLQITLIPVS